MRYFFMFFHPSSSFGEWWWGADNLFYNFRNTYYMRMKLCPSQPYLAGNIFKSKELHCVTSKHAQSFHI